MQRTEVLIKGKLGVIASTPRIVLPSDLSTSLQYLDGAGLERLLAAANAEMDRRKGTEEAVEIPQGNVNLIRASFSAGMKAPQIARTFGVPLSVAKRITRSTEKQRTYLGG